MPYKMPLITLSNDELVQLTTMSLSHTIEHRCVVRAKAILLIASGVSIILTSDRLNLSENSCRKWCKRFIEMRLEGLKDEKRTGRTRTISAETRELVLNAACTSVGTSTVPSQRMIAEQCNVSQTTVFKILREANLKPGKPEK